MSKKVLLIMMIAISMSANAYAAAYKNGDFQIWNTDS